MAYTTSIAAIKTAIAAAIDAAAVAAGNKTPDIPQLEEAIREAIHVLALAGSIYGGSPKVD